MLITNDVDEAIILAERIIALSPDGTLGWEFKDTIPHSRDRLEMNADEGFKRLRADVTRYLMDVGMKAKVKGTRELPDVSPIHGVPTVVKAAQTGLIDAPAAPNVRMSWNIISDGWAWAMPWTSPSPTCPTACSNASALRGPLRLPGRRGARICASTLSSCALRAVAC